MLRGSSAHSIIDRPSLITVIWNCIIRWANSNLQAIISGIFSGRPKARRRNSIPLARQEEPDTGAETNAEDNGQGMEQAWNPRIISRDHIQRLIPENKVVISKMEMVLIVQVLISDRDRSSFIP